MAPKNPPQVLRVSRCAPACLPRPGLCWCGMRVFSHPSPLFHPPPCAFAGLLRWPTDLTARCVSGGGRMTDAARTVPHTALALLSSFSEPLRCGCVAASAWPSSRACGGHPTQTLLGVAPPEGRGEFNIFINITSDVLPCYATGEESACMPQPSLTLLCCDITTSIILCLEKGPLVLSPMLVDPPPP
ncbi:unnamed protein product [Pleuronectes platessa]|uniref:Uncharacterized protein n=1 Tax=Pleuronectes platessa TaxID=8262 RepID=A0A9N7TMR2_PLEPL|nr:unnamed protein product [Pleuronectes platessa]